MHTELCVHPMVDKVSQNNMLRENAPKVFTALARFLCEQQRAQMEVDYCACVELGGNAEPGMVREEGVSFNPRLARVLSLLITDGGVRDLNTLRTALYAASPKALQDGAHRAPPALREVIAAVWSDKYTAVEPTLIRGVIELDAIRHLHQTTYPAEEREAMLARVELDLLIGSSLIVPEWLHRKLEHAITMQRRRMHL